MTVPSCFPLLSSQSKLPAARAKRAQAATKFVANFALTPLALCAAQLVGAQTLPGVTIRADIEQGYSPSTSDSATKSSAPLRDIPQSVNVVPGQLLREQAARSMEDALRNVPGVAASHGDGQRDQVVIRGFSALSDQFVDGVRDDALYFRDLSNIERVEVLKGPSAVLYGRGSSGGLINRITKKPKFGEISGEVALSLGSHSLKRIDGDLNMALSEAAAFRLNVAREDSGSYRDQQFVDRYSFAPSLALKLGSQTDLLLQYTKARDQRVTDFGIPALNGRPVDVPASTYYGSGNARRDDTSTSLVNSYTATLNRHFNDLLSVRNITRYYSYELDRYNTLPGGTTDPVALTVGRNRSIVLRDESGWFNQTDFSYKNTLGSFKQEWLFGLELGQQKRRSESISGATDRVSLFHPGSLLPPAFTAVNYAADSAIANHTQQDILGVYLQDQITLAQNWKALVGVRYDEFKQATRWDRKLSSLARTDRSFSPRAGLVWQPADAQSYYLSYSRSFQPSAEAFALAANNAVNAPEVTRNVEVGSKLDFLDGALSVTAALFNLERSNIKNTDPVNPSQQINVGKQRTNGLELAASGGLPGRWDVSAGYAYLDGRMVDSLARITSLQLPTVSVASLGKVPALAASYKVGRYEMGLNLKNVSDKKYIVSSHGAATTT